MMKVLDSASLRGIHETPEGYLEASVRIARTGIQLYRGAELGHPDKEMVRVYRGDDAVFDKASLEKFAHMPVTVEHPAELVDSKNWKTHAVGTTGGEIMRDGEFLKIGVRVTDADAVSAIKAGKREVSVGYQAMFDWTPGVTPSGEPYDARQTRVLANHLAITNAARAGSLARIGDSWGAAPITPNNSKGDAMATKAVTLGDSTVTVVDADAEKVEKVDKDLKAKDKSIAEKDAEIDKLKKKKQVSDSDLDKMVEARAKLVTDARTVVADMDVVGKSADQIKREAVVASGRFNVSDSTSEAYIDAAFDILTTASADGSTHVGDSVRSTLLAGKPVGSNPWGKVVDSLTPKKKEA